MTPSHSPVAHITTTVLRNLQDQHDWVELQIQHVPDQRPLIRGLPPRRLYIHPDDQIAALAQEGGEATSQPITSNVEYEWVMAMHPEEKWTLSAFAAVFDSIQHSGPRAKRIILATVHNDSTVVYYFMHEGIVKPRQN